MLGNIIRDAPRIYLLMGRTDFRKQIPGLTAIVTMQFKLDPFTDSCVFIFCNRRRNAIKVLRYDQNGFILATKTLMEKMKFQWPMKESDMKEITYQQVEWLLQGLEIEQKKALYPVKASPKNSCF